MKTIRKILIIALCLSMVLCVPLSTSAASADYFTLAQVEDRMTSDGIFVFNFTDSYTSETFTAKDNRIWIQTGETIFDTEYASERVDSSFYFTLEVFNASTGQRVNGYIGYADGIIGGAYFSVISGEQYYIRMVAHGILYDNEVLLGSGRVTPVTCP